jgi:hypothetical protein
MIINAKLINKLHQIRTSIIIPIASADKSSDFGFDKLKLFNMRKLSSDELKYFLHCSLNLMYSIADMIASLK